MKIIRLYVDNWRSAWKYKEFRIRAFISTLIFTVTAVFAKPFFIYIESRNGYQLNDFLLDKIQSKDFSEMIFFLIYFTVVVNVLFLLREPFSFLKYFQIYLIVISARLLCNFLIPLAPPLGMIVLDDPLVYGNENITKDLFFSGHVSTLFLLYMASENSFLKYFNLLTTILVAGMILIQHVHYTMDVVAAPIVVWIVFSVVEKYQKDSATVK
jgi:hypothetical protein